MNQTLLFDAEPPDREWVLEQGFNFNRDRWKKLIPQQSAWPAELDACSMVGRWPYVDRRQVFDVARRVGSGSDDPTGATQLYVAAAVWGTGTSALDVSRRIKVLKEPDVDMHLAAALKILQVEGPVSAYRSLSIGGSHRVKNLGPAFFSKFLYFAGFDAKGYMQKPLILDQHVARSLNVFTNSEWSTAGPWSTEQYARYLDHVDDWASQWDTSHDVVERQLFRLGYRMQND
ncbi:hypothetical protein ACFVWF_23685 [Rhodococcus qingshengii]|uniref:8-oxoguanine DNA glycosylase OGG fold protein n=1 Tax=Rhodococcus qingshengii TaxID=334542 RepID=UPI0036DC4039